MVLMCWGAAVFVFGTGARPSHFDAADLAGRGAVGASDVVSGFLILFVILACIFAPAVGASFVYTRLRWKYVASEHPLCPACEYDLSGVESGVCPECGEAGPGLEKPA